MHEIAVVIPCRDAGRSLLEALDRVQAQTRAAAETVVVDEGSEDAWTRQLLATLRRPRTRVVHAAGLGPAGARNHGVRLTVSPYVMVLEPQDLLESTYLEQAAARLDGGDDIDFVVAGVHGSPRCTLIEALTRGCGHPSPLFRRRVWEAVGGFDAALSVCLDQDFCISALETGFRGEVVGEPPVAIRGGRDSAYHRALLNGELPATMATIYRKHQAAVERAGRELLPANEAFALDLQVHGKHLEQQRQELQAEVNLVKGRIAAARAALAERGQGAVDWGELRRLTPLSDVWGLDRGKPLDRYYIEGFLDRHRGDVRGRVLEIKDPWYTRLFGGEQVVRSDVLDIDATNSQATLVADLTRADSIPSDSFDCFIFTQALHIMFDLRGALAHACRILKPGGVLLCTAPSVSRINYEDGGRDRDYWRFTEASLRELFLEQLPPECFEVTGFGNVLACAAFLYGFSPDELSQEELDTVDPWFPLIFAVRAVKPAPKER